MKPLFSFLFLIFIQLVEIYLLISFPFLVVCVVLCVTGPPVGSNVGAELCNGASPDALGAANERMCVVDCMQPVGVKEYQEDVAPSVCFSLMTCFAIKNE